MKTEPYKRAADVLYKLTAIYYENKRYAHYPRFKVWQQTLSYFHTLEDAEKRIRELVEDNRKAMFQADILGITMASPLKRYLSMQTFGGEMIRSALAPILKMGHSSRRQKFQASPLQTLFEAVNHSKAELKRSAVLKWGTLLKYCRGILCHWKLLTVCHLHQKESSKFIIEHERIFKIWVLR